MEYHKVMLIMTLLDVQQVLIVDVGWVRLPLPTEVQQYYTLVNSDYISNAAQRLYRCSLVQSPVYYFREENGYVPIH